MVNYRNGKIYKLTCDESDEVYIGSTCEKLCVRKAKHKDKYKAYLRGTYAFVTSFKLFELSDNIDIELIELFPCDTKDELHVREKYWIQNTKNVCNKHLPSNCYLKTKVEYDAEYYAQHKQKVLKTVKKYREENKEKIKEYLEKNKEKISERARKKYTCECGKTLNQRGKKEHEKTKTHIDIMSKKA
jgi:hypothetical protein